MKCSKKKKKLQFKNEKQQKKAKLTVVDVMLDYHDSLVTHMWLGF